MGDKEFVDYSPRGLSLFIIQQLDQVKIHVSLSACPVVASRRILLLAVEEEESSTSDDAAIVAGEDIYPALGDTSDGNHITSIEYHLNMPDETSQTLRQLKIKTGVVKRLHKEESSYIQEVEDQQKVVEKLKADGADGADIRAAVCEITDWVQMEAHQLW